MHWFLMWLASRKYRKFLKKCYFCLNQYEDVCPLNRDPENLDAALKCLHQRHPQTPEEHAKVL